MSTSEALWRSRWSECMSVLYDFHRAVKASACVRTDTAFAPTRAQQGLIDHTS